MCNQTPVADLFTRIRHTRAVLGDGANAPRNSRRVEQERKDPVPPLDLRVDLNLILASIVPCHHDLLGQNGCVVLHKVGIVYEDDFGACDTEGDRQILTLIERIEASRRRMAVVVAVGKDSDLLGAGLRREQAQKDTNRHLLTHELPPLIALQHPSGWHEEIRQHDFKGVFRILFVIIPPTVLVDVRFEQTNCLVVAAYDRELVLGELLSGCILMDRAVVDDEDLHLRFSL